jgi:hypothetical protein
VAQGVSSKAICQSRKLSNGVEVDEIGDGALTANLKEDLRLVYPG